MQCIVFACEDEQIRAASGSLILFGSGLGLGLCAAVGMGNGICLGQAIAMGSRIDVLVGLGMNKRLMGMGRVTGYVQGYGPERARA